MLYLPESTHDELARLYEEGQSGRISLREAGERLIALCPDYPHGYVSLWMSCDEAGDAEGAEEWLWRGLEHTPLDPWLYLALCALRRQSEADDTIARRLLEMACWQISVEDEMPELYTGLLQGQLGGAASLDFSSTETYARLATEMESARRKEDDPPEVTERLLPYTLINDLQRHAAAPAILDQFKAHAERSIPILHAAIRGWVRFSTGTRPGISMIAAVLGEIGPPELIPDLIETAQCTKPPVFLHAHWAVCRLGRRFPERALEVLRAMIPSADAGMRCAIAEQLTLLPDPPGLTAAYRELLAGFSNIAKENDAPYLLMSVLDALPGWEAGQLKKQYQPLLTREGREWVRESIKNDDFAPMLAEEGIDELTLEDVCLEQALMDEDDDDNYVDEDGEDGGAPQLVRAPRPGRNDPCWCGSGKKYKKCHLEADESTDRELEPEAGEQPAPKPVSNEVATALVAQMLESIPRAAAQAAYQMYFEDDDERVINDPDQQQVFIQWMLFDYRLPNSGRTVAEEFLKRRVHSLAPSSRQQVEAWTRLHLALLEVQRVEEGRGLEVKDILSGDTYFIHDVTSSREAVRWDCMLNRILHINGRDEFNGNGLTVDRKMLPELLKWIEKEHTKAQQSAADFVAANGHRLHRILRELQEGRFEGLQAVNFEGHAIAMANAVYEVRNEAEVLKGLRGMEEFIEDTQDRTAHRFGWLSVDKSDDGSRPSFGTVTVRDGRLTLETNSEQRLRRGRNLLELWIGEGLAHLEDTVESFEEVKRKFKSSPRKPEAKPLPREAEREIVLKYKQKHYATWPDEPLPALKGKTPREAVRTRDGREAVAELLREFENHEERQRKERGVAYDFSGLRRELGLE